MTNKIKNDFKLMISEKERKNFAKENTSVTEYKNHKKINAILNLASPILGLFLINFDIFSSFNIVILAIFYITFDILMGLLDNYLFNIRPQKLQIKLLDITERQKYVEKLKRKFEMTEKAYLEFKEKECANCYYAYGRSRSCTSDKKCSIIKDYEFHKRKFETENNILNEELKKIEIESLEKDTKISNEYKNKIEYFIDLEKKYSFYLNSKNLKILTPIVNSLNELIEMLNKKPAAISLVSNNLYLYLDELQKVLTKLEPLTEEQKSRYYKMISEISSALAKNIQDLSKRIDKIETEDIEVSLNVLYSELVKKEDENV